MLWGINIYVKHNKNVLNYVKLKKNHYHFKFDFQKVGQHTGGRWLINGNKHRKDNQLQSLELPCRIS